MIISGLTTGIFSKADRPFIAFPTASKPGVASITLVIIFLINAESSTTRTFISSIKSSKKTGI